MDDSRPTTAESDGQASFNDSDFDDTDQSAITELDAEAQVRLLDRQAEECDQAGDPVKALFYREQALVRRQETDCSDEEFGDFCYLLAVQYNSVAMSALRQEKSDEALTMLKKAEVLTAAKGLFRTKLHRAKLRALTFNNFGCVYKFCGRLHTALRYLDKALHIEAMFEACDNPAGTHLNVCAILSQMGRHRGALHHANFALEILMSERALKRAQDKERKKQAKLRKLRREHEAASAEGDEAKGGDDGGAGGTSHIADLDGDDSDDGAAYVGTVQLNGDEVEKASLLAIANYNKGVELEHLKMRTEAAQSYREALKHAKEDLGEEHIMTEGIRATLHEAKRSARKAQKTKQQKHKAGSTATAGKARRTQR